LSFVAVLFTLARYVGKSYFARGNIASVNCSVQG
jgi:hypothetical protein